MTTLQCWATAVFWIGIVYGFYVYFGFFLMLMVFARKFGCRPVFDESFTPSVSLLISAYNEERVIARKLQNALAQRYPKDKLEVCLVSDGSTDHTVEIAWGSPLQGVRVFHFDQRRGKNAALNDAIPQTIGEILVFTDANTLFQQDAVRKLARHFSDTRVGLVVGSLSFVSESDDTPVDGGLYWRYENRMKEFQSALRSVLVANGSIFAVRRELVGTLDPDVANDFQTPMEVGAHDYAILYEPAAIAIEKSASDQREEFARKVRIVLRGLTGTRRLLGRLRGKRLFFFVSHKLLRWFVGYVQIAVLLANAALLGAHPFYAVAMFGQVLFYLCALTGFLLGNRASHTIFRVPSYFCMVNAAAGIAFLRFLAGQRAATWDKAESAR